MTLFRGKVIRGYAAGVAEIISLGIYFGPFGQKLGNDLFVTRERCTDQRRYSIDPFGVNIRSFGQIVFYLLDIAGKCRLDKGSVDIAVSRIGKWWNEAT